MGTSDDFGVRPGYSDGADNVGLVIGVRQGDTIVPRLGRHKGERLIVHKVMRTSVAVIFRGKVTTLTRRQFDVIR